MIASWTCSRRIEFNTDEWTYRGGYFGTKHFVILVSLASHEINWCMDFKWL